MEWFGKGCQYLTGIWENDGDVDSEWPPEINHCIHEENHSDYEGNCNESECPRLKDAEHLKEGK